jgi:uncharacterized protein (UPF0305 family)
MEKNKNYRSYVKAAISEANRYKTAYSNNLVYNELCKWLKERNEKLDKEMFKAVLNTCNSLKKEYEANEELSKKDIKDIVSLFSLFFHTHTNEDGIHTDEKLLQKYVESFLPIVIERINEEKSWGDVHIRMRSVDVARLGKLFDEILSRVEDKAVRNELEILMNEFCLDDLERVGGIGT